MTYALVAGTPSFAELEFWAEVRKWIHTKGWSPGYTRLFPVQNEEALPSTDKQAFYIFYPHGLTNFTRAIHTLDSQSPLFPLFQNACHVVHGFFFRIPFLRELMLCGGCIPADRESMDWAARRGFSLTLSPGGAREVQYAHNKATKEVWLFRNRKGYLRFAKRHDLSIVPLYTAGEQDVFTYSVGWITPWLRWLRERGRALTGLTVDLNFLAVFSPKNLAKWFAATASVEPSALTVTCVGAPVVPAADETVEALQERVLQALQTAHAAAPAAFRRRRLSIH